MSQTAEARFSGQLKTSTLLKFAQGVQGVRDVARLHITPSGITAEAPDAPNVSFVRAELPRTVFDGFQQAPGLVGFNAAGCLHICQSLVDESVELVSDGDTVEIHHDDGVDSLGSHDPKVIRESPDVDRFDDHVTASATITLQTLRPFIEKTREKDAEVVKLVAMSPDGVGLSARNSTSLDTELAKVEFSPDDCESLEIDEVGSALLSAPYLIDFFESTYGSPPVTLRWGEESPLLFEYPLAGRWTDDEQGVVRLYLAPRTPKEGR